MYIIIINLIGYACNGINFSFLILILHFCIIHYNKTFFLLPLLICCIVFLHFSYSQSFPLLYIFLLLLLLFSSPVLVTRMYQMFYCLSCLLSADAHV